MHGTIDHDAPICHTTKRRDRKPMSLFPYLISRGGLRPCPDLLYILDKRRWILRKNGMTLDRAREACLEAHYLSDPGWNSVDALDTSTINDLLELIRAESHGHKQYPCSYVPEDEFDPLDQNWEQCPEDDCGDAVGAAPPAVPSLADHEDGIRKGAGMTAEQYRKALKKLGLSIVGARHPLGISARQAQRLASGESAVPAPIAKLLRLALAGKITLDDISAA